MMKRNNGFNVIASVIMVMCIALLGGCDVPPGTYTQTQPDTSSSTSATSTTSASASWHQVINFSGSSVKTTQNFHIDSHSSQWRVSWSTQAGDSGMTIFSCELYDSNGNEVDLVANTTQAGNDVSYEHGPGGDYYFKITAMQPYSILVEEYY